MVNLGHGRPSIPGHSRGIVPLIAAAIAAGTLRAGIGAITGNQRSQRNKGYINAAHRTAKQRLDTDQAGARQGIAEQLNARGLAQGGGVSASPIHTAMVGERMVANPAARIATKDGAAPPAQPSGAPATIGEQVVSDANVEMGLEQQDLEQQKEQALTENKAERNNAYLGSAVAGVQTGMSVYGAGKDLQTARSASAARRSKIHETLLSGMGYDGVNPVDPLGAPSSAWSTQPRSIIADPNQSNASFNVG